ncbi:glycosyltransferase family 2 protein [Salidesulfovibrio brasiliensis]|uniref:glycosyltransferase family 2 protein n=1 Tax=Salidesulfovibrio brasiliensis TaxID=221711 RepID=UPI0006D0779E|nr:glycosyltransferase family 2 protein [Salidesulfovibrio brasiliensis]
MSQAESEALISVVLPTRDRPDDLQNALKSLGAQTYDRFEVVVVNDGRTDVADIISDSVLSERGVPIRHVWNECDTGPSAARNRGLEVAQGDVIAYLDDDDFFKPNHLAVHARQYAEGVADVVYTDASRCRIDMVCDESVSVSNEVVFSRDFDPDALLVSNYIPMICLSHRRECIEYSGMFEESLSSLVDWDFFIRLAHHYDFLHLPEVTGVYVENASADSVQKENRGCFLQNLDTVYSRSDWLMKDDPDRKERIWEMRLRYVAGIIYETGLYFESAGETQKAYDVFRQAIETDAKPEYLIALSRVQKLLGQYDEAFVSMHLAQQSRELSEMRV